MKQILSRLYAVGTCAFLALTLLCPARAGASDFQLYFDTVFSASGGVTAPAAAGPWLDAIFQDVTPGIVQLTVQNMGLSSGEFVGKFYFNLNPAYDPTALLFTPVASSGSFAVTGINRGVDAFKADGDGFYDVQIAFPDANNAGERFDATDSVVYQITGTGIPGLTTSDFLYTSVLSGGNGAWYAAAHLQGLGADGSGSVWASPSTWVEAPPIPEPSAAALLAVAALLWGGHRPAGSRTLA